MSLPISPKYVFRRYKTDGMPESGRHDPDKAEIVQLLDRIEDNAGVGVSRATLAELNTVTPKAGTFPRGEVTTGPNAGWYNWSGSAWEFGRAFPSSFARLTITGGTRNAIQATSSADPMGAEAFIIEVVDANTAAVTISINGGPYIPVLSVDGDDYEPGEFTGRLMLENLDTELLALTADPAVIAALVEEATSVAPGTWQLLRNETIAARNVATEAAADTAELVFTAINEADRSEEEADRSGAARVLSEAARDASYLNGDVYADVAAGRTGVGVDGRQFIVVTGAQAVRYRRDTAATQTEMARYSTVSGINANVQFAGDNRIKDPLFAKFTPGVVALNPAPLPTLVQPGMPNFYVAKAIAAGISFPVTTVVDDQYIPEARTKRMIKTRQTRASAGTLTSDFQLKHAVEIPEIYRGRNDVEGRLTYFYRRQSANVDIGGVIEFLDANKGFISSVAATKLSTDVVGATALAVFSGVITPASAVYVVGAPRLRTGPGLGTSDVDEDAWLGPVFFDFNRVDKLAWDRNRAEENEERIKAAFIDRIDRPYLDGGNVVRNGALDLSALGANVIPQGFSVATGGAGTVGGAYSVVETKTPFVGHRKVFQVEHYNNGAVRTDRQIVPTLVDIPVELQGDTTVKLRAVQHAERSSLLVDFTCVALFFDGAGTQLATTPVIDLTPDKGPVNTFVALAVDIPILNANTRRVEVRWRSQVQAASGVVAGLVTRQTGFFLGWNRGPGSLSYDYNLQFEIDRSIDATGFGARITTLETTGPGSVAAARWIDDYGNAHRVIPVPRLTVLGDSHADGLEEFLFAAMPDLAGDPFGIGGEITAQELSRIRGYAADLSALSWGAGVKRLRAKRAIPDRVVSETYRSLWTSYGAKIAEPYNVEFFNRFGRVGQTNKRFRASATVSGDTWTAAAHPFQNGDTVHFRDIGGPANACRYKTYFVRDVAANTFKLSEFSGAAAVVFDAFGGSLSWLGDFYFDWTYDGVDDHVITVKTHCPTDENHALILGGTNDLGTGVLVPQVQASLQACVAQLKASQSRFLVMGIPGFYAGDASWGIGGAKYNNMMELHAWGAETFRENWYDAYTRLRLTNDGSANDLADIAAGYVPRSKRVSSTDGHLNAAGNTYLANDIKALFVANKWTSS